MAYNHNKRAQRLTFTVKWQGYANTDNTSEAWTAPAIQQNPHLVQHYFSGKRQERLLHLPAAFLAWFNAHAHIGNVAATMTRSTSPDPTRSEDTS